MKLLLIIFTAIAFNSSAQSIAPQKSAHNEPINKELIVNFMTKFEMIYQPDMNESDLDNYFNFMTDDVVDHHVAYNVIRSGLAGRNKARKGLLKKAKNSIQYELEIESISIGTSTAVVVYIEHAKYIKDKKIKNFKGRTIQVLEFDDSNKIKVMRRYQD